MSVMETDQIDSVGIDEKNNTLVFLIVDHLTWLVEEYEHLKLLQSKLNTYVAYIESRQYKSIYRNREFDSFRIEIVFKYQCTENCEKFLAAGRNQLKSHNIDVKYKVAKTEQ